MRKAKNEIESVKQSIVDMKDERVEIHVNKGRKKIITFTGQIIDIYPSVFTVKIEESRSLDIQSYSFSDVLTGDVKIAALDADAALQA